MDISPQSIFFDEPSCNKSPLLRDDAKSPPDWVNGELMSEALSSSSQQSVRGFGAPSATSTLRERYRGGLDVHRDEDVLPGNRRPGGGGGDLYNGYEAQVNRARVCTGCAARVQKSKATIRHSLRALKFQSYLQAIANRCCVILYFNQTHHKKSYVVTYSPFTHTTKSRRKLSLVVVSCNQDKSSSFLTVCEQPKSS